MIYLTRHGEGEHNLDTTYIMGRAPGARLTARGRAQAHRLGARLRGEATPQHIVCSSLPRTRETAEIIAAELDGVPVHGEAALWDLSKGNWEGVMSRTLPDDIRRAIAADPLGFRYGDGESFHDVIARVEPCFDRWVARHAGARLLFVLHADVVLALLHQKVSFPTEQISHFQLHPCSLTELRTRDGAFELVLLNATEHVADL
ncbi:MAG: histidine phosphatase family protein [Candidatus Lambdaproteobacteria bacterium]|nr:histidine phosphatase family protein [Candidatus Lambdaproteobacteria bacterium]